jgi:hypothetical protein
MYIVYIYNCKINSRENAVTDLKCVLFHVLTALGDGSKFTMIYCLNYFSTLKVEATNSSETSVDFQRTIGQHLAEHTKQRIFRLFTTLKPEAVLPSETSKKLQCITRGHIAGDSTLQSQSRFTTDGLSVSMCWCRAPSGAHDQIFVNCLTGTVLSYSGALSDERSDLSFVSHSLKSLTICTYIFKHFVCLTCVINTIYTSPSSVQARYSRLWPTGCG